MKKNHRCPLGHLYIQDFGKGWFGKGWVRVADGAGHFATLERRDLGQVLAVLDQAVSSTSGSDGGFRLEHHAPCENAPADYVATFPDGATVGFGGFDARVLKYALQHACFAVCSWGGETSRLSGKGG